MLIEESEVAVGLSADGCRVVTGRWTDPYSGIVRTLAGRLDVDHTVPLADAHRSGGARWDGPRKARFANDLSDPVALVALDASTNRSKGDRAPDEWKPRLRSAWCGYADAWVRVKHRWQLTVTAAERAALVLMLATC